MTSEIKSIARPLLIGFFGTAAFFAAQPAFAQESERDRELSGYTLGGVAMIPEYEGSSDQQYLPLVGGEVRLGERYVALEGTAIRLNFIESRSFELGPVANVTFGRDRKIEAADVARLGKIGDAFEVGAFAAARLPDLLTDDDELRLSAQALRDVSDTHDGWTYEASLRYRLQPSARLGLSAETSMRFADDAYAGRYFSVTADGAALSGLPAYRASGGIKDVGASLTATYAISDKWFLAAQGGYRRLLGDFADSPVVDRAGSADQWSGAIGIGFRF
jgi:outer membrane scaffolding protein for murein synthesis (MipA/OmpV family)